MNFNLTPAMIAGLCFLSLVNASLGASLEVTIEGVNPDKGKVIVGLYDPASEFPHPGKQRQTATVVINGQTALATFDQVEPGRYAVAVYQDANNNGTLDKNFLGKPKEPYGFSNNPRSTFGPPSFDEAAFTLTAADAKLTLRLK